jgi:hypothetical protein
MKVRKSQCRGRKSYANEVIKKQRIERKFEQRK